MIVTFPLESEYIELAALLKATGLCPSGGTAKTAVIGGMVRVDGAVELRRGRKIRRGQKVEFEGSIVVVE